MTNHQIAAVCRILLTLSLFAHAQERPPSDFIKLLSIQTNNAMGLFSCGQFIAEREVAESLAHLGKSAIPDIERELDLIDKNPLQTDDISYWLPLAYARIKGKDAFSRLQKMERQRNMDKSIALSLGITSYVSDSGSLLMNIHCARGPEPRGPLDKLILAWEKNDRAVLEANLGSNAKASLHSLLSERTWDSIRAQLWHPSSDRVAMGYRFQPLSRWSEPVETLDDEKVYGGPTPQENPHLDTVFMNKSGVDCGRHTIEFVHNAALPGLEKYQVDNPDMEDLLKLISACANN